MQQRMGGALFNERDDWTAHNAATLLHVFQRVTSRVYSIKEISSRFFAWIASSAAVFWFLG